MEQIEGIQFNETPQMITNHDVTYNSPLEFAEALAKIFEKKTVVMITLLLNLGT